MVLACRCAQSFFLSFSESQCLCLYFFIASLLWHCRDFPELVRNLFAFIIKYELFIIFICMSTKRPHDYLHAYNRYLPNKLFIYKLVTSLAFKFFKLICYKFDMCREHICLRNMSFLSFWAALADKCLITE